MLAVQISAVDGAVVQCTADNGLVVPAIGADGLSCTCTRHRANVIVRYHARKEANVGLTVYRRTKA